MPARRIGRIKSSPTNAGWLWSMWRHISGSRADEQDRRRLLHDSNDGLQTPGRQALHGIRDLQDVVVIQIEAINIRPAAIRISVVRHFFIAGNFEQSLPETFCAEHSSF